MGQKHRRIDRDTDAHDPETIRLRREGKLLLLTRKEILMRVLDEAIHLWFDNADPISVHILACVAHKNVTGFARVMKKPSPPLHQQNQWEDVYSTYNHVRHNEKGGDPNHRDQFSVENNQIMLFDCVHVFGELFSFRTPWMGTFASYMIASGGIAIENLPDEIFPGVSIRHVVGLSRQAFVQKMYPLYVADFRKRYS
jgi:hypothetical protein